MEKIVLIHISCSSSLFNVNALKPSHHAMRDTAIGRERKVLKVTLMRCSGSVFPLPNGSKHAVGRVVRQFSRRFECLPDFVAVPSEKGVAGQFVADTRGNCRFIIRAFGLTRFKNALRARLLGSTRRAKRRLRKRVFVRAEDQRFRR